MGTEKTKICKECSTEKSLDEYYVRKDRHNAPYATCKDCTRTRNESNKRKSLSAEKIAQIEEHRQQKANLEQGMKGCLTCKQLKPVEDYMTRTGKIKYSHCHSCRPELDKEYFKKNPSKREAQHKTVLKNRAFVADYTKPLKEKGCADCKKYYPDAMEFDHTCHPSEKFSNIATIDSVKGSSESIENLTKLLEAELAKGEYVCSNCHRRRTYQRSNSARIIYMSNPHTPDLNPLMKYVYDMLFRSCCIDCKEEDFLVLEFDHVRGSKAANISQMIKKPKTFTLSAVIEELVKCDIRCGNCHRRRTRARQLGEESTLQSPKDNSFKVCQCGNRKTVDALVCINCHSKDKTLLTLDRYGDLDTLLSRLADSNFTKIGKELGVSGNAVKKYIQRRGIDPKTLLPMLTDI